MRHLPMAVACPEILKCGLQAGVVLPRVGHISPTNYLRGGVLIMRSLVAAAVASFTLAGLSYAQDAKAAIKQYQIAAQSLGEALRDFASQSDMQLIFSESEVVGATSRGV